MTFLTRREWLAGLVAGGASGLAGCSGDGGADGGTTDGAGTPTDGGTPTTGDGSGTPTGTPAEFPDLPSSDPTYRQWLGDSTSAALGAWSGVDVARLRASRGALPAEEYALTSGLVTLGDYVGVEFDAMSSAIFSPFGPGIIYPGSFDRERITGVLGDAGYEQFDSRGDATFYRRSAGERYGMVAVGDAGVIKNTGGPPEAADAFVSQSAALFETAAGERSRRHETSEPLRRYTDAVGFPLRVNSLSAPSDGRAGRAGAGNAVNPNLPDDVRASVRFGTAEYLIDGAIVDRIWLWTVEDGELSPEAVREAVDRETIAEETAEGHTVAVRSEGRVNDVAITRPLEEQGGAEPPLQFSLRASVTNGTLTVRHVGGDSIPVERLSIRAGGEERTLGGDILEKGGSVTTDLDGASGTVRVFYRPPSGRATVVAEAAA